MIGQYLKKVFGKGDKEVPENEQFFSPLRIALHSTITFNSVDWIVLKPNLGESFVLPTGKLEVLAVGQMDADEDKLYNVYTKDEADEEFIFQLFCSNNFRTGDEEVVEATLYKQVVHVVPTSEDSWDAHLANVGMPDIELDAFLYSRIWGDEYTEKMDLLYFHEKVVAPNKTYQYDNHYMLYGRPVENPIGDEVNELLLIGVEESEESAELNFMLGLTVPVRNIEVQ